MTYILKTVTFVGKFRFFKNCNNIVDYRNVVSANLTTHDINQPVINLINTEISRILPSQSPAGHTQRVYFPLGRDYKWDLIKTFDQTMIDNFQNIEIDLTSFYKIYSTLKNKCKGPFHFSFGKIDFHNVDDCQYILKYILENQTNVFPILPNYMMATNVKHPWAQYPVQNAIDAWVKLRQRNMYLSNFYQWILTQNWKNFEHKFNVF